MKGLSSLPDTFEYVTNDALTIVTRNRVAMTKQMVSLTVIEEALQA